MAETARKENILRSHLDRLLPGSSSLRLLALLLAVGLPLLVTVLISSVPLWYQKEFTVSVTPVLTELQESLGQTEPVPPESVSPSAPFFLREQEIEGAEVASKYRSETQQAQVFVQARDRETMGEIDDGDVEALVKSAFGAGYEITVRPLLDDNLSNLDPQIEVGWEMVEELDRRIEQASSSGTSSPDTEEQLRALESERERVVASLESVEQQREYLEQARENLPTLAQEIISTEVVEESDTLEPGFSLLSVVILAILFGFGASAALVLRSGNTG